MTRLGRWRGSRFSMSEAGHEERGFSAVALCNINVSVHKCMLVRIPTTLS